MRRLQPGEWSMLRTVRLAALSDAPEAFGSTFARERAFSEAEWRERAASALTFLAWQASEPIGLITVIRRQDDGEPLAAIPEWELISMWVSPGARGSGCADLLVAAAVEAVRAESAPAIALWVTAGNDRARAFYLRCGFRPAGVQRVFTRHDGSEFEAEKLARTLGAA